jgi:hypothetical protein
VASETDGRPARARACCAIWEARHLTSPAPDPDYLFQAIEAKITAQPNTWVWRDRAVMPSRETGALGSEKRVSVSAALGGFLSYEDAAANAQKAVIRRPLCGA